MFSGILEGMETFRIPNSTPNAVPGRAQGLVDRIAGAFRALLMDGNAETIPNPPSSRPPARPFPSSSRNRLRSWLPEGFDSVCWPEQCPPLFKPCVPGKKGRKASFIPPSGTESLAHSLSLPSKRQKRLPDALVFRTAGPNLELLLERLTKGTESSIISNSRSF